MHLEQPGDLDLDVLFLCFNGVIQPCNNAMRDPMTNLSKNGSVEMVPVGTLRGMR